LWQPAKPEPEPKTAEPLFDQNEVWRRFVERLGFVKAMKATELDCAGWRPGRLRELAGAAIETVRAQDLAKPEPDPKANQHLRFRNV
jgi:hypothetical protein